MLDHPIPPKLQKIVERELDRGERVVWSEMPSPTYFGDMGIGSFVFGVPWTAFISLLLWESREHWFKDIGFFFVLGFLFLGLAMLTGPLWTYRNWLRTVYLVTDRRAITIDGGMWYHTIRSYTPDKLNETFHREYDDGTGEVIIAQVPYLDEGEERIEERGFFRINDSKAVESLLREMAEPPQREWWRRWPPE